MAQLALNTILLLVCLLVVQCGSVTHSDQSIDSESCVQSNSRRLSWLCRILRRFGCYSPESINRTIPESNTIPLPSKKDMFLSLPKEAECHIFEYISSIDDIAHCTRVCHRWQHSIQTRVMNVSRYFSLQDYLLAQVQKEIISDSDVIWNPKSWHKMCNISHYVAVAALIQQGRLKMIQDVYNIEPRDHRNMRSSLLNRIGLYLEGMNQDQIYGFIPTAPSEAIATWFWQTIRYFTINDLLNVDRWKKALLYQSIQQGYLSLVVHMTRHWIGNHVSIKALWKYAVKSPDRHLFNKLYFEPLLNSNQNPLVAWSGMDLLGDCKVCTASDLRRLFSRFADYSQDAIVARIVSSICQSGHVHMLRVLASVRPIKASYGDFRRAIQLGHSDLIDILKTMNPYLQVSFQVLQHVAEVNQRQGISLSEYNRYIDQSHSNLTSNQSLFLLDVYMKNACGNEQDLASLESILPANVTLSPSHLDDVIKRCHWSHTVMAGRICKKRDTLKLVTWLVDHAHVEPNSSHVNLALSLGRLDLVLYLHQQLVGKKEYLPSVSWFHHVFRPSNQHSRHTFQEPALIDFVFQQVLSTAQSRGTLEQTRRDIVDFFQSVSQSFLRNYDCYYPRIGFWLGKI